MSRRSRIAVVAGMTAAAIAAITIGVVTASNSPRDTPVAAPTSQPGSSSTATATPGSPATPAPAGSASPTGVTAAEKDATTAVTRAIDASNAILGSGGKLPADLGDYTADFVQGEFEALATERAELGYTQVGKARITSVNVRGTHLDSTPEKLSLNVCIDSTKVDVLDANGASLKSTMYNPGRPVLNIYGAELRGGVWKITTHDIPSKDTCK